LDEHGEKLEKPVIYAFIKFEGKFGGLIHRLGEVKPEEVEIGMLVETVFNFVGGKSPSERVGMRADKYLWFISSKRF